MKSLLFGLSLLFSLHSLVCVSAEGETAPLPAEPVEAEPVEEEAVDPLASKPTERDEAVRLQIYLDQILFGPGFIDGKAGKFTEKSVYAYNRSKGRVPDDWRSVREEALKEVEEVYATAIVPEIAKKYVNPKLPKSRKLQAKQKQLGYRSYVEFMAERYHTSEGFLIELNSRKKVWGLKPRGSILVPNVEPFLIEEMVTGRFHKEETELSDRTVIIDTKSNQLFIYGPGDESKQSAGAAVLIVDEEGGEAEHSKLLAVFPITPGRSQFIHRGEWKVVNCVEFPQWSYDPSFLKTGKRSKDKSKILRIPGGPNNPVGVVWSGLSKSGIGIHGTSSPRTIGRSVSAGCIRLSNWDAARFPYLIRPGAKAVIR